MKRNICPFCGGRLVIEFIGSYGDVYMLNDNGKPQKKLIHKCAYGYNDSYVYCWDCGKGKNDHVGYNNGTQNLSE